MNAFQEIFIFFACELLLGVIVLLVRDERRRILIFLLGTIFFAVLWFVSWVISRPPPPPETSTPNATIELAVSQTLDSLTNAARTSTPSETAVATATSTIFATATTRPSETSTPTRILTHTSSPLFAVTDVDLTVSGGCGNFIITAHITVNEAGSVRYHWVRSDGAIDRANHDPIIFASAGTQSVSTAWFIAASGSHWMEIYIDIPNDRQFGRANFSCP